MHDTNEGGYDAEEMDSSRGSSQWSQNTDPLAGIGQDTLRVRTARRRKPPLPALSVSLFRVARFIRPDCVGRNHPRLAAGGHGARVPHQHLAAVARISSRRLGHARAKVLANHPGYFIEHYSVRQ